MRTLRRRWMRFIRFIGLGGCAVEDFQNDPLTEAYGENDCAPLVRRGCNCPDCRASRRR